MHSEIAWGSLKVKMHEKKGKKRSKKLRGIADATDRRRGL